MTITCCLRTFPISHRDPDTMEILGYTATETLLWDYSETEGYYVLAKPPDIEVKTLFSVPIEYAYQWFGLNGRNGLLIVYYPFNQINFRNLHDPCTCPPVVTSISPDTGAIGITVTIGGRLFTGVTLVTFGGVPATSFIFVDDNTITAVVPTGTDTVNIVVTTSGGVSTITPADQFTYTVVPVLSCPDPGAGLATIVNADNACLLNADNNCITSAIATYLPWPASTYDPTTAVSTTLSNGNLTASNQLAYWRGARSTTTHSSGKWYAEITMVKSNNAIFAQGGIAFGPATNWADLVEVNGFVLFPRSGEILENSFVFNPGFSAWGNDTTTGDVLAIAVDMDNLKGWFRIVSGPHTNLNWNGSGAANPATNVGGATLIAGASAIWAAINFYSDTDITEAFTANFGGSAFTGAAPAGFSAWGNTATWDPATNLSMALSGGNLVATNTASDPTNQGVKVATALAQSVGRYYFESTLDVVTSSNGGLPGGPGIALTAATYPELFNFATNGASLNSPGGSIFSNGNQVGSIDTPVSGDTIGIAVDLYNHKIWFKIVAGPSFPGALWNGDPRANPAINMGGIGIVSGSIVPVAYFGANKYPGSSVITVNFNPAIIPI